MHYRWHKIDEKKPNNSSIYSNQVINRKISEEDGATNSNYQSCEKYLM